MEDAGFVRAPAEGVAFLDEIFYGGDGGRGDAEPLGLLVEMEVEREIGFVDEDWRAGGFVEGGEAADVVNVGVSADDGADFESVLLENLLDGFDVVAWIYDDGFVSGGVAEDGAVALEHAYGDYFVDEG